MEGKILKKHSNITLFVVREEQKIEPFLECPIKDHKMELRIISLASLLPQEMHEIMDEPSLVVTKILDGIENQA